MTGSFSRYVLFSAYLAAIAAASRPSITKVTAVVILSSIVAVVTYSSVAAALARAPAGAHPRSSG
jgi:hypothetical protein